jgi:TonB family protein
LISIRRDGDAPQPAADLAPTLAATRFAPAAARRGCSITYTPTSAPIDQAPIPDLMSYSVSPQNGPLPQAGWDRIRAAGNCLDEPRPQPLVRVLPDFTELPRTPGIRDWAMVDYDTDAQGRPVRASVSQTTGNKALEQGAVKAMRQSRFTGGARTGCRYPFWTRPAKLEAPAAPEEASFRSENTTCTRPYRYATKPRLTFPEAYRRRMIEGWAVISFDVAPWGEIGNLKVLAAQPSEDFGTQATQVLRSARFEASMAGMSGCIERVRFVMGPDGMRPLEGDAPQPDY